MFATHWRWIEPFTTGDTLKKLGLEPGPVYKSILSDLKSAWLNGKIKDRDDEEEMLKSLIGEAKSKNI